MSANKLILCSVELILKPDIYEWVLIFSAKSSIARLNMRGERGHPHLVPFDIKKGLDSMAEQ